MKGKPQNSFRVAPEVQQYTGITISGICPFLGQPKHAFIYAPGAKHTALGIHRLEANPMVQEVSPRIVSVRHQRYNKKPAKPAFNQRLCRQSRAVRVFPIQFPVLCYPCPDQRTYIECTMSQTGLKRTFHT